ncbi:MAG: hypothetical protein WC549_00265 [Actinomycetota bacterium]
MKLLFNIREYQKFRIYVEAVRYEISGLGKIRLNKEEETIIVEDIKIFNQEVSYANTVLDKRALSKFYDELIKNGESPSDWKLWWHSHGGMETFWSNIDVRTIEDFDTEQPQDNWLLSVVTNHKKEMLIRLDVFDPIRCTIEGIEYDFLFTDEVMRENLLDEVTEKVVLKSFRKKETNWDWKDKIKKPFYLSEGKQLDWEAE